MTKKPATKKKRTTKKKRATKKKPTPKTEVVVREPSAGEVVAVTQSGQIFELIEKASKDPSTDVEKLERLLDLYKDIDARRATREFDEAMRDCQAEMPPVPLDGWNDETKSKYPKLQTVNKTVRPVYSRHGFSVSFTTRESKFDACICVVATVSHNGGGSRSYEYDSPIDDAGPKGTKNKTRPHAHRSALTYAQRALLCLIFNLQFSEDDDGNGAGTPPDGDDSGLVISAKQVADLESLISEVGADRGKFLNHFGIQKLEQLPHSTFKAAVSALEAKRGAPASRN